MIRIRVYLPMGLSGSMVDAEGWMTVPAGTQLKDLAHLLKMPQWLAKIFQMKCNGLEQPMDTVLQEGDVVSFFSLLQGG